MDTLHIENPSDFEKIRHFRNNSKKFKIVLDKDIVFNRKFIPINYMNEYTIYLEGNNHTISNIDIYDPNQEVGIFTKLDNLYISNLNIIDSYLYGGVLSGIVCGDVEHETCAKNVNLDNVIVSAEAYSGGIVGCTDKLIIEDSTIRSEVHGYDVVGGVAGMANQYYEDNCDIYSTILVIGKAAANNVGYSEHKYINTKEKEKKLSRRFRF